MERSLRLCPDIVTAKACPPIKGFHFGEHFDSLMIPIHRQPFNWVRVTLEPSVFENRVLKSLTEDTVFAA